MFRIDKTLVKLAETKPATTFAEPEKPEEEIISAAEEKAALMADMDALIKETEQKAKKIIEKAEADAKNIIKSANSDADTIRSKAQADGYKKGEAEAAAKYNAKIKEDDDALKQVLRQLNDANKNDDAEAEVIKLTLEIAKKIVTLASENDEGVFESMIVSALRRMKTEGKITLRVSAQEYDRFFASGSAVLPLGDGVSVSAAVIKDPQLGELGLVIDTDDVTVDAGLDSQLKLIELAFFEEE